MTQLKVKMLAMCTTQMHVSMHRDILCSTLAALFSRRTQRGIYHCYLDCNVKLELWGYT